jgi:Cu-processing system permease protein
VKKTLRIARFTLQEAISRRMILAGVLISVVYLVLFALAYNMAADVGEERITGARSRVLVGIAIASLTLFGLYVVNFLSGFLALFLSVGAISAEIDGGTLHALLARPIKRWQFLLGRWIAYAALMTVYVIVMSGLVMVISHAISGYEVPDPIRAMGLMIMASLFLLTLSMLGSTFLPTLANGVIVFTMLGLGWLGGIIEVLGGAIPNEGMMNLGTVVGILIPSDTLWRAASHYVQSSAVLAATQSARNILPLLANAPPTTALIVWGFLYPAILLVLAVRTFAKRDL